VSVSYVGTHTHKLERREDGYIFVCICGIKILVWLSRKY